MISDMMFEPIDTLLIFTRDSYNSINLADYINMNAIELLHMSTIKMNTKHPRNFICKTVKYARQ